MKPSRNDACPCGSGRKYKQCCMNKQAAMPVTQKVIIAVLAVMLLGGLVAVFISLGDSEPRGRVWSEEHQHWH